MSKKLRVLKYNGNDNYSYAVFYAADVKGLKGVVFQGQATPIVNGLGRREATARKTALEAKL